MLIAAGLSVKLALVLNLLSALTEVVGLYVGFAIASVDSLQQWMLAIVAGMFIYVSLVGMVSLNEIEMKCHENLASKLYLYSLTKFGSLKQMMLVYINFVLLLGCSAAFLP